MLYLYSSMTTQIEVELCRVSDPNVHCGSRGNVSTTSYLVFPIRTEKSGVVAFLHDNECDSWLVT